MSDGDVGWPRLPASVGGREISILSLVTTLFAGSLQAQPGSLDPSFRLELSGVDEISAVEFQPDGKIIIAGRYIGWSLPQGCVARLHPNGQFDASFKVGLGPAHSSINTVLLQPDGKIVVGGAFTNYNGVACGSLVRVNADGTLDPSFDAGSGIGGYQWHGEGWAAALLPQGEDKILVLGGFTNIAGVARPNFARLNANGSVDESFAPALGPANSKHIAVQPDGRLLVERNSSLVRLKSDGSVDETFKPALHEADAIYAIALEPNGRILLAGSFVGRIGQNTSTQMECSARVLTLRLNSDGTRDPSFIPLMSNANPLGCYPDAYQSIHGFRVQPDGKIIIHGGFATLHGLAFGHLARLNGDGTLDGNFDTGTGSDAYLWHVYLERNSNLLISGLSSFNGEPVPILSRVIGGEPAPRAPSFKKEPVLSFYDSGRIVALTPLVSVFPLPSYQWRQNGRDLAGASQSELILTNVNANSVGAYQLQVVNSLGSVTSQALVLSPPELSSQPGSQMVRRAEDASFSVAVTNSLPLSFQWQFERTNLVGATNATLVLTNVQPEHAGAYSVLVTNTLGSVASALATLTVLEPTPPEILRQPQSQTVEDGIEVSFSVEATNYLPLAYQWQFNSSNIAGATQAVLTLPSARPPDAGAYTVLVSSEYRTTRSAAATLVITPVQYLPGPGVVTNADQARLEAAIELGVPVTFGMNGIFPLTHSILITRDTTLDGTGRSIRLDGQNLVRHFVVGDGITLRVINLTLMNGRFAGADGQLNEPGEPAWGGSIYTSGGTIELIGCRFIGNSVLGGSGGLPIFVPPAIVADTRGARAFGGALFVTNGILRAQDCVFAENRSTGGRGLSATIYTAPGEDAFGGAIYLGSSASTLAGVTFTNNIVQGGELWGARALYAGGLSYGGALANAGGTTVIHNCVFVDNQALGTGKVGSAGADTGSANGGAVFHAGGRLEIDGTVFSRNMALGVWGTERGGYSISSRGNGGAIYAGSGSIEIRSSGLVYNEARGGFGNGSGIGGAGGDGFGGCIYNKGDLAIVNCSLVENEANGGAGLPSFNPTPGGSGYGGGIYSAAGTVSLLNVTVALNSARAGENYGNPGWMLPEGLGSSFYVANSVVKLTNSIVSCSADQTNVSGTVIDGGHNLASDASASFSSPFSRNNTDPLLAPLGDHGGGTPTMALLPGSPAIDAGSDFGSPSIDQRGVGRPAGLRSDIGAYELALPGPPAITLQPRSVTVAAGLAASFQVAVNVVTASYQWQFNGSDLAGETNSTLALPKVQLSNAGEYVVRASNALGSVLSAPATLTVLPPMAPVITSQPRGQTVPEGQTLVLSVTAANPLALKYQWQHNGTDLPGETRRILTLTNAAPKHGGIYTVVVSTEFLSTTSLPAPVSVAPPLFPSIILQPVSAQVNEGQTGAFSVAARGGLPLSYQWSFEGVEVPGATEPTLTLTNVPITRAGAYTVTVQNSLGAIASEPAVLTVKPGALDLQFIPPTTINQGFRQMTALPDGKVMLADGPGFLKATRLHSNGSVDTTLDWPFTFGVEVLIFEPDGKIIAAGYFTSVAGIARYMARLNPDGSLDSSLDPAPDIPANPSMLAREPDGKILVVDRSTRSLIRLGKDGKREATLPLELEPAGLIDEVLVQNDGQIIIRIFNQRDAELEHSLVRLSAAGVRDPAYNPSLRSNTRELTLAVQPDGKLLAGGNFFVVNGIFATNLVRLNRDGTVDLSFQAPSGLPPVLALAAELGGKILVGCESSTHGLLRLNADGSSDPTVEVNTGPVHAIALGEDGQILIRGPFNHVNEVPRPGLARLSLPNPVPRIQDMIRIGPMVRLSITTFPGHVYLLERSQSLGAEWSEVQSIPGDGTDRVLTDTNAPSFQAFYRVRVQ